MARFRATIQGQRGSASRLGSAKSGINALVNGWNGGIRVSAFADTAGDRFEVYQTGGSHARMSERWVGTLRVDAQHVITWERV